MIKRGTTFFRQLQLFLTCFTVVVCPCFLNANKLFKSANHCPSLFKFSHSSRSNQYHQFPMKKQQNGHYAFSFGFSSLRNRHSRNNPMYQRDKNGNIIKSSTVTAATTTTTILSPETVIEKRGSVEPKRYLNEKVSDKVIGTDKGQSREGIDEFEENIFKGMMDQIASMFFPFALSSSPSSSLSLSSNSNTRRAMAFREDENDDKNGEEEEEEKMNKKGMKEQATVKGSGPGNNNNDNNNNDDNEKKKKLSLAKETKINSSILEPEEEQEEAYYNKVTVGRQLRLFWNMSLPYFQEERSAKILLAMVLVLTLANSGVSVAFSYIGRDFWTALSSKNTEQFYFMMQKFFGALCIGVPVSVMYKYQRQRLSLQWRSWLTDRITSHYYNNRAFYLLENSKEIDNPDQRIAEDIKSFTDDSLNFLITALTAVIDLVAFSSILFKIYPQLFVAIILYASIGTIVTSAIGKTLVGQVFNQLQKEADFRYSMMRVRENAESIAFYNGERLEVSIIQKRFQAALDNFQQIIKTQRNLEFFTVSYRYLIQVIPGLVVAPLYFAGSIELGVVSQSYGAFNHILSDLSIIVNQFESLSSFSAGIDRLAQFLEKIEEKAKIDPTSTSISSTSMTGAKGDGAAASTDMNSKKNLDAGEADESKLSRLLRTDVSKITNKSDGEGEEAKPFVVNESIEEEKDSKGENVDVISDNNMAVLMEKKIQMKETSIVMNPSSDNILSLSNVTVLTPDRSRTLVTDLSLALEKGSQLLIVGNSGTGKSSLLRAIAGLWSEGKGEIIRPPMKEVYFLPQRPYCTLGPLRDQLTYPYITLDDFDNDDEENVMEKIKEKEFTPEEDQILLDILDQVGLSTLAERMGTQGLTSENNKNDGGDQKLSKLEKQRRGLNVVKDWSAILSLGEQQRIAFGRVLFNKPYLAVLDEATSALDLSSEERVYKALQKIPNISYISVGHRPSLINFHNKKLILKEGGFEIEEKINNNQ